MDQTQIIQITSDSINDKTTFLDAIRKLRNLGVFGYRVDVNSHSKIIFDQNESFVISKNKNTLIQRTFDKQKIVDALRKRQTSQINFDEFMRQIGDAGVFDYIVDIAAKTVIYRGLFDNYSEKIPI